MTGQYHADHKAAVMSILERNRGNIQATAEQTGIGERTLYRWQLDIQPYMQQYAPPMEKIAVEMPTFANDLEALAFIRQNIIGELSRLSAMFQQDTGFASPFQRARVMSQLMDKLLKLDLHLRPLMQEDEDDWMEGFDDEEPDGDDEDA